jgi:predicted pyridoxine 5'-phosphate oxidase superfamily flavin-nucleotide-binding protein
VLFGQPGFLDPCDDGRALRIVLNQATRHESDPFWRNIRAAHGLGTLVIDSGSRRRLRINGRARSVSAAELMLDIDEAYPNCPKYVQRRHVRRLPHDTAFTLGPRREGTSLDPEATACIRGADTFFVASAHPSHGLDVSHRGGNPGFVKVLDGVTLIIPDYAGNGMFNTLGNLSLNRNAGLAFPDFDGHRVLQLTGTAGILWDQPDEANETGGTGRFWQFHLDAWLETPITAPMGAELLEYSPFNPPFEANP